VAEWRVGGAGISVTQTLHRSTTFKRMEPSLPPLHPRLPELLDRLQLRVVDAVTWNVLACVEADDPGNEPTLVLKFGDDARKSEIIAYESRVLSQVLPIIDQTLFERLVLPEYVKDGTSDGVRWMLMRYIKGKPLVHQWSEMTSDAERLGGRKIDPAVGAIAVDVLRDLRSVDIKDLPKFVRRFDFAAWLMTFSEKSADLVKRGLLEQETVDAAEKLFSSKVVRRYEGSMFTNGDFHPRNFIFLPEGKIAVVDWTGGIDPWEFAAMHAWLLMWGNPAWQQTYVGQLQRHFPVDINEMQIGLLVKSFDAVQRWRSLPEDHVGAARTQMIAYFRQCTDADFVRQIFG
jgi:hypothetical protein